MVGIRRRRSVNRRSARRWTRDVSFASSLFIVCASFVTFHAGSTPRRRSDVWCFVSTTTRPPDPRACAYRPSSRAPHRWTRTARGSFAVPKSARVPRAPGLLAFVSSASRRLARARGASTTGARLPRTSGVLPVELPGRNSRASDPRTRTPPSSASRPRSSTASGTSSRAASSPANDLEPAPLRPLRTQPRRVARLRDRLRGLPPPTRTRRRHPHAHQALPQRQPRAVPRRPGPRPRPRKPDHRQPPESRFWSAFERGTAPTRRFARRRCARGSSRSSARISASRRRTARRTSVLSRFEFRPSSWAPAATIEPPTRV